MNPDDRCAEAIKQARIASERAEDRHTRRNLGEAIESLRAAQARLERARQRREAAESEFEWGETA